MHAQRTGLHKFIEKCGKTASKRRNAASFPPLGAGCGGVHCIFKVDNIERCVAQKVPALVALGGQILRVVRRGPRQHAVRRYHVEAGLAQRRNFARIVSHEPHRRKAELLQHFAREIEAALILAEAQKLIGVVGVEALFLQAIGADLVGEAVAASLLVEVEHDAAALLAHGPDRAAQLIAAIAFKAAEEVAGQAGGMDARQHRALGRRVADDDGDLVAEAVAAAENDELAGPRAIQRNLGARDDLERARLPVTEGHNVLRVSGKNWRAFKIGGAPVGHGHGGQQERKIGKRQGREFGTARRREHRAVGAGPVDRAVVAVANTVRDGLKRDRMQVHGCGGLVPRRAGTSLLAWDNQPCIAPRTLQERDLPSGQSLGRKGEDEQLPRADGHGPRGAELRQRALHGNLTGISETIQGHLTSIGLSCGAPKSLGIAPGRLQTVQPPII